MTHAPALVGVKSGIFAKDLGQDKLDATKTFNAGPAETEALLSGAIDETMPSVAWLPLAIVLFQLSEKAIFFVLLIGAVPSIANGVIAGVDNTPSPSRGTDLHQQRRPFGAQPSRAAA